jgi:hypothetical protein
MEKHEIIDLHSRLKSLLERCPDFESPISQQDFAWLGQAHALVNRWDTFQAMMFMSAADYLNVTNIRKVFAIVHHAVADLELKLPKSNGQVFGPGAVYDFFTSFKDTLALAETKMLLVDPYLDESIFEFLGAVKKGVNISLLACKGAEKMEFAMKKFQQQQQCSIQIRKSKNFHDRALFLDGVTCWVIGQSIKDAAAEKPTYLAPLSSDLVPLKTEYYEKIWHEAVPIEEVDKV